MVDGLAHVLMHLVVGRVQHRPVLVVHVHQEAIFGHALRLLGWRDRWTEAHQTDRRSLDGQTDRRLIRWTDGQTFEFYLHVQHCWERAPQLKLTLRLNPSTY